MLFVYLKSNRQLSYPGMNIIKPNHFSKIVFQTLSLRSHHIFFCFFMRDAVQFSNPPLHWQEAVVIACPSLLAPRKRTLDAQAGGEEH